MKKQSGYTIMEILIVLIILAGGYGYVANLVKLIMSLNVALSDITLLIICRIIGIFAFPLGCVLGYF